MERILSINPGSTSTKLAYYLGTEPSWKETIVYSTGQLKGFDRPHDQLAMRMHDIERVLSERKAEISSLSCVVARGGLVPHGPAGAIEVTPSLLRVLRERPVELHISNIGAELAAAFAERAGVKAYIYDPVTVDEMIDVVRITGLPEIVRRGQGHNLNMRAAALRACEEDEMLEYCRSTLIVAHLGGGSSMSLHREGRMIDMISDEDGAFSPERAGELPAFKLAHLIFDEGYSLDGIMRRMQREGGLVAYFGTSDLREVEQRIDEGEEQAALVFEAMALAVAKNIAKLAVVVRGKVDRIVLTGGAAYSQRLTDAIKRYADFLAPVMVIPGENELDALARGALRVLRGQEKARCYEE